MPTFSGIVVATGVEASGRRTLLDIVDELARPVDAADTTVRALASDAFREAVRTMNRKGLWPWEVMDEDVAITANSAFSSVTSAIKKPLTMHFLSAAGGTPDQRIYYEPYNVFIERSNLDIGGEPSIYTIPNLFETGQVRWFPVPNSADNARFTFYRVTPIPKAEQEVVEVPEYALGVYTAFAWFEFLKRLPGEQRPFPIEIAAASAMAAFRELSAHVAVQSDRSPGFQRQ